MLPFHIVLSRTENNSRDRKAEPAKSVIYVGFGAETLDKAPKALGECTGAAAGLAPAWPLAGPGAGRGTRIGAESPGMSWDQKWGHSWRLPNLQPLPAATATSAPASAPALLSLPLGAHGNCLLQKQGEQVNSITHPGQEAAA